MIENSRLSVLAGEFLKILWTEYQDAILLFENSLMICSGAIHALGKKTEGWQRRRSRRKPSELKRSRTENASVANFPIFLSDGIFTRWNSV